MQRSEKDPISMVTAMYVAMLAVVSLLGGIHYQGEPYGRRRRRLGSQPVSQGCGEIWRSAMEGSQTGRWGMRQG